MLSFVGCSNREHDAHHSEAPPRTAPSNVQAASYLAFGELLERGPKLAISERARSHNGQRVLLEGYMADLELPPRGAFYLVPIPVTCDEASDGAADLPPTAVLVNVNASSARDIPHLEGLLQVTGKLSVGRVVDSNGRSAWFSVTLDVGNSPNQPAAEPLALR